MKTSEQVPRFYHSLRISSIILLAFNGASASAGGVPFMLDPTGSKLKMSTTWLKHSPFENYLLPGIILFSTIGVFSLVIAVVGIFKWSHYGRLVWLEGIILVCWIIIQATMLQTIYFLHLILGLVGLLLVLLGVLLELILGKASPIQNKA
jgi:hypothetical protein